MKIFLLTQDERTGYDTYDSCVVCAESIEDAKTINPEGKFRDYNGASWASSPDKVRAEEIGVAYDEQQRGIVLSSFNAG